SITGNQDMDHRQVILVEASKDRHVKFIIIIHFNGYEYYVEQEKGCFMFMDCPGKAASEKRACSMLEYEASADLAALPNQSVSVKLEEIKKEPLSRKKQIISLSGAIIMNGKAVESFKQGQEKKTIADPGGCALRNVTQDHLDPGFTFLRSTWTRTGTYAGTGGPRPGRSHLPRVPRAEDGHGPGAMGDAPWELVSRDGVKSTPVSLETLVMDINLLHREDALRLTQFHKVY
ncbi:hypothetical protein EI555_004336, partial [Monodon monoceros]